VSLPIRRAAELRTERLVLRRARPDDLDAIHAIMADPETMRFWATSPHASRDVSRSWLDSMLSSPPDRSDDFVIELAGEAVGKLGAWRLPEMGFLLRRDLWGRGLASEALAAYLEYMAGRGVPFLAADVDPRNQSSLALLARFGFRITGGAKATYEIGDEICDSLYLRRDLVDDPDAAKDSPVPHFLLRYKLAPDYLERRSEHRDPHLALAWAAAESGALLLGGAVGDPVESALLLFTDEKAAADFARADPYVEQGLVQRWQVTPWHTVVGGEAANPVRPRANG
jgi:ribosomal-protein-alanine N-acetyltransferase